MHVNLDPFLVDKIVGEVKSQGAFDQFRRDSMSDVDTKPAYQNLRQRVEASVFKFLSDLKWKPETNKNQLREKLRKHITDAGFLDMGVERIVDQVVNPKISAVFQPKIEDIAYKYLGIEKPQNTFAEKLDISANGALAIKTDLLPNDLEAVSPDSDSKSDSKGCLMEHFHDTEEKNDEFESPPFEPLEGRPPTPIQDERSNQSHLSGISGLTSQDSISSERELSFKKEHCTMHESVLSQVSSSSRLSMAINEEEKMVKPEIEAKPTADMSEEAQMPSFSNAIESKIKPALHFDINKQEFKFEGTTSKFINAFYGKSKKGDLDSFQTGDKKDHRTLSNDVSNLTSSGSESKELTGNSNLGLYESVSKEPHSFISEALKMREPISSNTYDDEKLNTFDFKDKSGNICKKMEKSNYKDDSKKSKEERNKSYPHKRTYYKETVSKQHLEKSKERAHGDKPKFITDEKNDMKAKKFEIDDHFTYRIKGMRRRSTESDDEGEKTIQKTNLNIKQENSEKTRESTYMKNTTTTNSGKQKSESNGKTHPVEEILNLNVYKSSPQTKFSCQEDDIGFHYFEIDALEEQLENEKIECLSKLIEGLLRENSFVLPGCEFKTHDSAHSSNVVRCMNHPGENINDTKISKSSLVSIVEGPVLHGITHRKSCSATSKRKRDIADPETFDIEKRRKMPHDYFSMPLPLSGENIVKDGKNFISPEFSNASIIECYVDDKGLTNALERNSSDNLAIPTNANIHFKGHSFREDIMIMDHGKQAEVTLKETVEKKSLITMKGTQRYSNEDLYKPRPALSNRSRRRFLDNEVA